MGKAVRVVMHRATLPTGISFRFVKRKYIVEWMLMAWMVLC